LEGVVIAGHLPISSFTIILLYKGCAHGELDRIYASIKLLESRDNIKVDLLLICGDFQVSELLFGLLRLRKRKLIHFWARFNFNRV
jgi:hypothetical protein